VTKKVLVVIDMQKDFLELDGKLSLGKDTTEFKARVAKYIKEFDGEVIATLDTHQKDSAEFAQFPPHCVEGTTGHDLSDEIAEAIKQVDGIIQEKISFTDDEVVRLLLEKGFSEYEFVGVCTHICLHDNVAALYHATKQDLGKLPTITVQRNLVDDFDDEMAEGALKRMERLYNVKVI